MFGVDIGDSPQAPSPLGTINVDTNTAGEDIDSDGYTLSVGDSVRSVGVDAFIRFDVAPGTYSVALADIQANCMVDENPQTVSVGMNQEVTAVFDVTCAPQAGSIQLFNDTDGDPMVEAYSVTVTGEGGGGPTPFPPDSNLLFTNVAVGDHEVTISGIPDHCFVLGQPVLRGPSHTRSVTVFFEQQTSVSYDIDCTGVNGALRVTTQTGGASPDPDGYLVTVASEPILFANDFTYDFAPLAAGDYEVFLSDVATNCVVAGGNQIAADQWSLLGTVVVNDVREVVFEVDCPESAAPVDPVGVWNFELVVTRATGVCADELGDASNETITITKSGAPPVWDVAASGFLGDQNNVLNGSFDEATGRLVVSGNYPEDGGTTTATHELTATSDNEMVGTEMWNWDDGAEGTCPGSLSSVAATRVP